MALYEARLREIKAKAGEERAAMIKEAQKEEACPCRGVTYRIRGFSG